MARMLSNLRSRSINPKSASSDLKTLPEPTQKAVISLQASTTEFLRQFWNSIAPTTDDNDADGGGTWNAISSTETEERRREVEENRLVQARKMALNLVKFRAKVERVFEEAGRGVDEVLEAKVEGLLAPTSRAVEKAVVMARSKGII